MEGHGIRTENVLTLLSSTHGRERRALRRISKYDLKAAVKHGTKEHGYPRRSTGEPTWKYTYADVVYITDDSSRNEITSWNLKLDLPAMQITPAMAQEHRRHENLAHSSWNSHTVLIIDQSGSMKTSDVDHGSRRSDTVWEALALDFVAERLENGSATAKDFVSLVSMRQSGEVLLAFRPMDWVLYNDMLEMRDTERARGDGNYLPALDVAEVLLQSNTHGSCALLLLFLSDGKPSDRLPKGTLVNTSEYHRHEACDRIGEIASRFGRRLTVGTIGFGDQSEDFSILQSMAARTAEYGSTGVHSTSGLNSSALTSAISSLTDSLTATKTEMTACAGSPQRIVRDVKREAQDTLDEKKLSDNWFVYHAEGHKRWSLEQNKWLDIPSTEDLVAMRKCYFGEGAERIVKKFRLLAPDCSRFVGVPMVAKESRFVEEELHPGDAGHFHIKFCQTQLKAQALAHEFNSALDA